LHPIFLEQLTTPPYPGGLEHVNALLHPSASFIKRPEFSKKLMYFADFFNGYSHTERRQKSTVSNQENATDCGAEYKTIHYGCPNGLSEQSA